jgi:membrane protease YdiL (CAAX protease family)
MSDTLSLEVFSRLQLVLILGVLSSFAVWMAWKVNFFRLPIHVERQGRVAFLDVLGAFIVFLTAEIVAIPVLFYTWQMIQGKSLKPPTHLDAFSQGLINLAAIGCAASFIAIYCLLSSRRVLKGVFGDKFWVSLKQSLGDFFTGAYAWLVAYPLVGLASQLLGLMMLLVYQGPQIDQVAVKHLKDVMVFPSLFWSSVILIISVVPILEEVLFRGFLHEWLVRLFGVKAAILLTASTFALFHFSTSQGADNVELIISLFVLGCFLSFLKERQRSLWAPIGLHSVFNAVSVLMITASEA